MTAPPSPPYIPAKHKGGHQSRLDRIVLHGTVSQTKCGGAENIARYFQNPTYVSSAHYVVDPCSEYQCVYDHTIAYHDGTNVNSIGVEMCDPVEGPLSRWTDKPHQQMLHRTAKLVRQLCRAYDIPMRKLTPHQIARGEKGICGHDDMRDAFPGSTSHWDPGAFPWVQFIGLVQARSEDDSSHDEADDDDYPGDTMIELKPAGEHATAVLIPWRNGLQLVVAVGDSSGGTPYPDLVLHNVKQFYGDGSVAHVKNYHDRLLKPGTPENPTWDLKILNGVVSVRIEYSYSNTVHTASAGFRAAY